MLLVFGAKVNSLDGAFLTPLDVAVDCNNEAAIALLQRLGGVQGEWLKRCRFSTVIPRLNTLYDVATIKAQVITLRSKSRRIDANRDGYYASDTSASGSIEHAWVKDRGGGCRDGGDSCRMNNEAGAAMGAGEIGEGDSLLVRGNSNKSHGGCDALDGGMSMERSTGHDSFCGSVERHTSMGTGQEMGMDDDDVSPRVRLFSNQSLSQVTLKDIEDGHTLSTLYERLQQCINMTFELSGGCDSE
jgi:hypothetical protein